MRIEELLVTIKNHPQRTEFDTVMAVIQENYIYHPAEFTNGEIVNGAGTNEGSCKIFAFGQLQRLDEAQTLACFGKYYREDVLDNPEGNNHGNIRAFIETGWGGVKIGADVLRNKA